MVNFDITLQKCKKIWFDDFKKIKIRRKEGLFLDEELQIIDNKINWINRKKDNIKEKVMYMAHEIFEPLICPITKQKIKTYNPLYRNYTDDMIRNKCFISDKKIKNKLTEPFFEDYNYDEVEKILQIIPNNIATRYPVLVNHCWVGLKKRNFDISNIESNEEAFYLYKNKFENFPHCPISGKKRKFSKNRLKYLEFDSLESSYVSNSIKNKGKIISKETIEKRKTTSIQKYGVSTILKLKYVYEKSLQKRRENSEERKKLKIIDKRTRKEKWLDTIKTKYNVLSYKEYLKKYHSSEESIKKKIDAFKLSIKRKYGVEKIRQIEGVNEKIKNTCLLKYGATTGLNTKEQKEKRKIQKRIETYYNFSRFKSECIPLFTLEEWLQKHDQNLPWKKTNTGEIYYCKYWGYAPIGKFKSSELERSVQSMLDFLNIEYIKNTKDIISPMELDIYIPKYKIAIECNGEYYHSTRTKSKNYHLQKKLKCNEKGIKLLHFYGKDITNKENKVFNIIKTATKGNKIKIFARKCFLVEISNEIAKLFLNKYHFDGFCNAKNHFGLFYKNRLISVLSLSKARFLKNSNDLEIIRYATMKNVFIVGGFNKFISHIKKIHKNKKLHTYADLNLFSGDVYSKNGFNFEGLTPPDYYYYKDKNNILSRYQSQKHKLKNILKDNFDFNKTEEENMNNNNYYRVYGCGNKYFTLNL